MATWARGSGRADLMRLDAGRSVTEGGGVGSVEADGVFLPGAEGGLSLSHVLTIWRMRRGMRLWWRAAAGQSTSSWQARRICSSRARLARSFGAGAGRRPQQKMASVLRAPATHERGASYSARQQSTTRATRRTILGPGRMPAPSAHRVMAVSGAMRWCGSLTWRRATKLWVIATYKKTALQGSVSGCSFKPGRAASRRMSDTGSRTGRFGGLGQVTSPRQAVGKPSGEIRAGRAYRHNRRNA